MILQLVFGSGQMKWMLASVSCVIRMCHRDLKLNYIKWLSDADQLYYIECGVLSGQELAHPGDASSGNRDVEMDVELIKRERIRNEDIQDKVGMTSWWTR